jgi:hypothetical protein
MRLRYLTAALAAALISAGTAQAATMQCAPYQTFSGAPYPGGNSAAGYTTDADGIVTGVAANDVNALHAAGCVQIGVAGYTLIGRIAGANMNATTDQKATMFISPSAYYVPSYMIVKDCSVSLSLVQGAVYDAASKGGNTLFGSTTQAMSACTGAGTAQSVSATTAGSKIVEAETAPPILSLTTAQGAAATANVYFYGYVLGQ